MKEIIVNTENHSYEIVIGRDVITDELYRIKSFVGFDEKIAIISDKNVWALHGEEFLAKMKALSGVNDPIVILIRPGEESKNLYTLGRIFDTLAQSGLSRKGLIIAFGGGVVGDVSGFAAACWMRGVKYVQIPTTLLAMVDSSVGGKTAIDIRAGKNLVGAFYQPSLVLIDPQFLDTLPHRELMAGMAEVIKTAAIKSTALFSKLESFLLGDDLTDIISDCVQIKKEVVEEDEFENGQRKILNFGHTFGHAIEVKHGFSDYLHGEAVSAGMIIATKLGVLIGMTGPETEAQLVQLLKKYNLYYNIQLDNLLEYIRKDKKVEGEGIDFVFVNKIGEAVIEKMSFIDLENNINKMGSSC